MGRDSRGSNEGRHPCDFGQLSGISGWQVVSENSLSPNDETGNEARSCLSPDSPDSSLCFGTRFAPDL